MADHSSVAGAPPLLWGERVYPLDSPPLSLLLLMLAASPHSPFLCMDEVRSGTPRRLKDSAVMHIESFQFLELFSLLCRDGDQ